MTRWLSIVCLLMSFPLWGIEVQKPVTVRHVKVEPVMDVMVQARGSGAVVGLLKSEGDRVQAGDPLVSLDDRRLKIDVRQAESRLKAAKSDFQRLRNSLEARLKSADLAIEQSRRDLRLAETQYLMQKDLKDKDMVSELDFLMAEGRWESAKVRVEIAEQEAALSRLNAPNDVDRASEQVAQAQGVLELAQIALGDAQIKAPFEGVVQSVEVEVGQLLSAGAPVARIIDASRLILRVDVPARFLATFRQGCWDRGLVALEGHEALDVTAQIVTRAPIIDSASGTLGLTLEIDNADGRIIPGGFADITLALRIPAETGK